MARVKEIICNQSITINTGNFENKKVNYGEVWELAPGDNPEEIQKEIQNHVHETIHNMAENIRSMSKLKNIAFGKSAKDVQDEDFELENRKQEHYF